MLYYIRAKQKRSRSLNTGEPQNSRTKKLQTCILLNCNSIYFNKEKRKGKKNPKRKRQLNIYKWLQPPIEELGTRTRNLAILFTEFSVFDQATLLFDESLLIDKRVYGLVHSKVFISTSISPSFL